MEKKLAAAFVYRICALLLAVSGLIMGSGFGTGLGKWFFYTQQSNLLIAGLFLYLTVRTGIDLTKSRRRTADGEQMEAGSGLQTDGRSQGGFAIAGQTPVVGRQPSTRHPCPCYCPRFQMAATLMITFTLLVFWFLLAPFAGSHGVRLWTYGNLAVHVFTPLAAIFDYFLFCKPGRLKKRDVFLCLGLPVANLLAASVLGLCGMVFYVDNGIERHFPYYFMDFHLIGWLAAVFLSAITFVYFLCAVAVYRLDRKRAAVGSKGTV